MYEIRFHGRGGQGAVMAAQTIAEAAVYEGMEAIAFPFFGAERRGAPVMAFARIDDKKICPAHPGVPSRTCWWSWTNRSWR